MEQSHAVIVHRQGTQVPAQRMKSLPVAVTPMADIYEAENEYVVRLDLPGAMRESIRVELRQGNLSVIADVAALTAHSYVVRHREIVWNRFVRSFNLGRGVREAGITASVANGVLTVRIPKTDDALIREIPIR